MLLNIVAWLLAVITFAGLGYWLVALVRARDAAREEYSIRSALELPERTADWPSVIVPVHNEEHVIQRCISSLLAQEYDRI